MWAWLLTWAWLIALSDATGTYVMSIDDAQGASPSQPAHGSRQFSFAKNFNHHMVLQRAPVRAALYGFSPSVGHKVLVQMEVGSQNYYYTTHVTESPDGDGGVWRVSLDPMESGTTVKFVAISEHGIISLADVIFGDVWLCSGQSNMQFTVSSMFGAKEEIANAGNYPNIRLMTVALVDSDVPLVDLPSVEQDWARASPDSVGGEDWSYFSAVCWVYGKAIHEATGIPIGLIVSSWGGTPIEAWSSPDALQQCGVPDSEPEPANSQHPEGEKCNSKNDLTQKPWFYPQNNSVLWNAMIHPLLPMSIYGVVWYQGEADVDKPAMRNRYNCTFPTMISDWREKFHSASQSETDPTFPFGFVQLSAYKQEPASHDEYPEIRWHQTADYGYVPNPKMPRVFMAVAMDLPDFNSTQGSIHPRDKKDVGSRLAIGGLAIAYNRSNLYQGPLPLTGKSATGALVLDYGSQWTLNIRTFTGFDLFCPENDGTGIWEPVSIIGSTNTTVSIFDDVCNNGENPTRVRYAWRESPCDFKQCAVYSIVNNLPGPPFVADLTYENNENVAVVLGGSVN